MCKAESIVGVWPWTKASTLTQTETINTLRQQIDQLGTQLWQQQAAIQHKHLHFRIQPCLPHHPYIITVKMFQQQIVAWLKSWMFWIGPWPTSKLSYRRHWGSHNLQRDFAQIYKQAGIKWHQLVAYKTQVQERFSECRSANMAKHKLTQLKQLELPMHVYITKFGDMAEYAYSIKPTDSASIILASNFIEQVQNPHGKNKLMSYQAKNLKDIIPSPHLYRTSPGWNWTKPTRWRHEGMPKQKQGEPYEAPLPNSPNWFFLNF